MPLTDAQIEQRRGGIGASDLGVLVRDPHRLWLQKRGLLADGGGSTPLTDYGDLLEPVLLQEAERRLGLRVRKCEETLVGPEPWILATPDGLVYDEDGVVIGLVEAKTANAWATSEWGAEGTDEIPVGYLFQTQWQLLVGRHCYPTIELPTFVCAEVNHHVRGYRVEYHEPLVERLLDLARSFWAFVERGTPPPIDGSASARKSLEALFPPPAKKDWREPDDEVRALVDEYRAAKAEADAAARRLTELENRLCERIGDGYGFRTDGWSVSWGRANGRRTTDWKAVAEALGAPADLIEQHTKQGKTSRRFTARITDNGDPQA